MSETDAVDPSADAKSVAATVREASFLTLLPVRSGDAIAAAGLLADAARATGIPFQVRSIDDPDGLLSAGLPNDGPDDRTLVVGCQSTIADASLAGIATTADGKPASAAAYRTALELGGDPDPVLALAGAVAAGTVPGDVGTAAILDRAEERDRLERRPGVGLPVRELADGLAHSVRFLAPFSGDTDLAGDALDRWGLAADADATTLATDRKERVASLLAIEVATADGAIPEAATAIEAVLRPYATDGPFATLSGYAEVLDVLASERPGTAIALALDRQGPEGPNHSVELRESALETWRDHARRTHRAIDSATTGRYDGSLLARVDADPEVLSTIARLLCDYRSPEPVVVVIQQGTDGSGGAAAGATRDPGTSGTALEEAFSEAAAEFDGTGSGTTASATARFDGDPTEFAAAVRGRL
ncbi:putative exonuclease RecJ [Halalkaliarchaeum desulfuricum]|uniref:Putative exonuclease RecJ n=1 Tax=Halalkaliarchaeum desulfuricum TaxID=2055893 RepID=A0A343TME3_9EURY|nr:exonuclease RecJ [Halalkaliarchaeum desulfuricum]AUX10265.1 putative exonuclease RecJ [Halalkaliarchaeum desulfuricum]